MGYKITKAAFQVEQRRSTELEIGATDRQQRRFTWITIAMIGVSFVHMFGAVALFSGGQWYEYAAAALMTGMVDVATWALGSYKDYAKRRQFSRSGWVHALFLFALALSFCLNLAYLLTHMPSVDILPVPVSIAIAVLFSLFIPSLIGVAALIRGELEDDKIVARQGAPLTENRVTVTSKTAPSLSVEMTPQLTDTQPDVSTTRAAAIEEKTRLVNAYADRVGRNPRTVWRWLEDGKMTVERMSLEMSAMSVPVDAEEN